MGMNDGIVITAAAEVTKGCCGRSDTDCTCEEQEA